MLRVLVAAVVVLASCKGGGDSTTPTAAGTVLEVSGAVKAGARALAVRDTVSRDDVIETGADGRVVIELAHNSARWELGPNKHQKVGDSIAWNLPKQDGPAKPVEQATAAAGREAERTAAEGAASTSRGGGGGAPGEGAKSENAPVTGAPALEDKAPAGKMEPPPAMGSALAQPPAPPAIEAAKGGTRAPVDAKTTPRNKEAPPPPPSPQKADREVSVADASKLVHGEVSGNASEVLGGANRALARCLDDETKGIRVSVKLGNDGKITSLNVIALIKDGMPANAKVRACVKKVVDGLAFPAKAAEAAIEIR